MAVFQRRSFPWSKHGLLSPKRMVIPLTMEGQTSTNMSIGESMGIPNDAGMTMTIAMTI